MAEKINQNHSKYFKELEKKKEFKRVDLLTHGAKIEYF